MSDHVKTEAWLFENFTFQENHITQSGEMYETYGEELEHIQSIAKTGRVWTYQDDDNGNPCICSGMHFVNRIGYYVSDKPMHEDIYIKLEAE